MISAKTAIACLLGFTAGAAFTPLESMDMTRMPLNPSVVHAKLAANDATLASATATAAETTGFLANSASVNSMGNIEVDLYSATHRRVVTIDGTGGKVTSNEDRTFMMPGDPAEGDLITLESGLQYYELTIGEGELPLKTSRVKVHYSGWTLDGKQFDSSYKRGQPLVFALSGVIQGWTEGVGGMKPGGKRKLLIPGKLGYGQRGSPRAGIPPNAVLIFDVELIEIVTR